MSSRRALMARQAHGQQKEGMQCKLGNEQQHVQSNHPRAEALSPPPPPPVYIQGTKRHQRGAASSSLLPPTHHAPVVLPLLLLRTIRRLLREPRRRLRAEGARLQGTAEARRTWLRQPLNDIRWL